MITVTDSPHLITPRGQKLIVMASSDNVGQTGFKFKVVINDGVNTNTVYVSPNPSNRLIIDVKNFIILNNAYQISSVVVHAVLNQTAEPAGSGYVSSIISVSEAWLVLGVLTDDPASQGDVDLTRVFWNATYQASDGYKSDPNTRYALNANTDRWLSDRDWDTNFAVAGITQSTTSVFIPVREEDYGVLSIIQGLSGDTATRARVRIFDSGGTPHSFTVGFSGSQLIHLPFYPANLNASSVMGWEKPVTYPGWRYIEVIAQDAGFAQVSVAYILYNVSVYGGRDCKHDNVRLAWKNFAGGWDYFNFTKRNENSINLQRKRYQRIIGDYNGTSYTFTKADPGLLEREPIIEQFLEVNSDWIKEQEFVFLESLVTSRQVHWLHDDGTITPVLIETNDYKMPRERSPKQKQLSLKLKLANDMWT